MVWVRVARVRRAGSALDGVRKIGTPGVTTMMLREKAKGRVTGASVLVA